MLEHKAIDRIREVACHQLHPSFVRLVDDAGDLHAPCCQLDDEKNVIANQSGPRDDFDREEVHRHLHAFTPARQLSIRVRDRICKA